MALASFRHSTVFVAAVILLPSLNGCVKGAKKTNVDSSCTTSEDSSCKTNMQEPATSQDAVEDPTRRLMPGAIDSGANDSVQGSQDAEAADSCGLIEININGQCLDGLSYCSEQEQQFSDGACTPCETGTEWQASSRECVEAPASNDGDLVPVPTSGSSQSNVPDNTNNTNPSPPIDNGNNNNQSDPLVAAPKVNLKLEPTRSHSVYVRAIFASLDNVTNIRYKYTKDTTISLSTMPVEAADGGSMLLLQEPKMAVTVTFDFGSKHCVINVTDVSLQSKDYEPVCQ